MDQELDIGIKLPKEHVTQKGAVIAMTGSGKSYGVSDILEEYCKYEIPFVLIDVLGAHWGIREKYPVVVFGGRKGDINIESTDGIIIGELIVKQNLSCIIDVSQWEEDDMRIFVAELLTKIFELNETPRHIFVEEAEVFSPQQGDGQSKVSLIAMNRIMKRGRQFGLGMTLISQRPADLNKRTLSQSQCTFFMHLESSQDLDAVENILKRSDNWKELLNMLPTFQQGESLLYSPSWLGRVEKFKFRKKETYHAGDTPELGKEKEEPRLIDVDLKEIVSFLEGYGQETPDNQEIVLEKYSTFFNQKVSVPLSIATAILIAGAMGWLII